MGARLTNQETNQIWELYEADLPFIVIAETLNRGLNTVRDHLARHRWKRPKPPVVPSGVFLTMAEGV